ncbi:hypothetical protein SUDANB171_05015 [Streptomyces sp. enrichment culture]|uniref:hypothetical protein n=1 Tax=Streptomyces sp. enrichment culture TaxID=1795815 RepID=UPI003F54B980
MRNDGPIPLSAGDIPEGTRDWRARDAERWLAVRAARWAWPVWAVVALVVTAVWATASVSEPACTDAAPCGPEWWGFGLFGAGLLTLYALCVHPALALVALGPVLALVLLEPAALGDAGDLPRLAVAAAGLFGYAGLHHRRDVRRRQGAVAAEASGGIRHRAPLGPVPLGGGRIALVVGVLLLTLAAGALWQALRGIDRDASRAAAATAVSAEVTDRGADTITVTLPSGDSRTLSVAYPEDYAEGATIGVLIDGDWARTVAEPYDPFGWQLLLLGAALPGSVALLHRAAARRRTAALMSGPQPVLRVLAAEGKDDSRTYVHAADDHTGSQPLFSFYGWPEPAPEDADPQAVAEEVMGALRGSEAGVLREAVLYGTPHAGAGVAVVMAGEHSVTVERSITGARPETAPATAGPRSTARRPARRRPVRRTPSAAETAAGMTPGGEPLAWRAGAVSRAVGLFLLLFNGGCLWLVLHDGIGWNWLLLFGLPSSVNMTVCALNWRITADRDGLWVTGPWRVHRIPWEQLASVRSEGDGLRFRVGGRREISLPVTGLRPLEHRLHGTSRAETARNEIRALDTHPALRPDREASAGEQGFPLGPVIAVLIAAWSALVYLF